MYTRKDSLVRHIEINHKKKGKRNECTYKGCEKIYDSPGGLKNHVKLVHENRRHVCTICTREFDQSLRLKKHIQIAHGDDNMKCEHCPHQFGSPKSLTTHLHKCHPEKSYIWDEDNKLYKCVHSNCNVTNVSKTRIFDHFVRIHFQKNFKCTYWGCGRSFSQKFLLSRHMDTHLPKTIECDQCDSKFSCEMYLDQHIKTYHGEKRYFCNVKGCGSSGFVTHAKFHEHMKYHNTKYEDYRHVCETCGHRFYEKAWLREHERIHANKREFECRFKHCTEAFNSSRGRLKHEKTHSNYNIKKQSQEGNLYKKLKEWGYPVDFETTINASRGECLSDTERSYARLDFHIINCVNAILIIECDENQHRDSTYPLRCELSRMVDVHAALVKQDYSLPIYWIRYSPSSGYHIGDTLMRKYSTRLNREEVLREHVDMLCQEDYKFDRNFNVHYMFYDLKSEEEGPKILSDQEYDENMKSCVTWHI